MLRSFMMKHAFVVPNSMSVDKSAKELFCSENEEVRIKHTYISKLLCVSSSRITAVIREHVAHVEAEGCEVWQYNEIWYLKLICK